MEDLVFYQHLSVGERGYLRGEYVGMVNYVRMKQGDLRRFDVKLLQVVQFLEEYGRKLNTRLLGRLR